MPDSVPPTPPPNPVAPGVTVNAPSGDIHLTERRAVPTVHVHPPENSDAGLWKYIPASMRPWVGMGILGIFVGLFLTQWYDRRDEQRQERAEARADRAEDREIMRAGIATQERRAGTLEDRLNAISQRIEASATEMRANRLRIEALAKELQAVLDHLVAMFKKPVGVILRALAPPEEAPPPRAVSPRVCSR